MAVLRVAITVVLDGDEWDIVHTVPVPPDYRPRDIEPFIQHELDKAMDELQREAFGFSRSEQAIRQYDRRITLIRRLLRLAPHSIRNAAVARRIREIIDMDQAELFARFGDERLDD